MENSHGSSGAGTGVSLECLTLQIESSFNVENESAGRRITKQDRLKPIACLALITKH